MKYPDKLKIVPLKQPPKATVRVPGSKSITNRALVLAALTGKGYAWTLRNVLRSEDTELMVEALRTLGFRVLAEWPESEIFVSSDEEGYEIPAKGAELFVGNSGTTMRFLTALVSLGHGKFRLDGVKRMRERPIDHLLSGLRQLRVNAYSENGDGCPPVIVQTDGLMGGTMRIRGDTSSQFLSGLMMAAPFAQSDVRIEVVGPLVSWPYVYMTERMMDAFGLTVTTCSDSAAASRLAVLTGSRDRWRDCVVSPNHRVAFEIPGRQWKTIEDYKENAVADAFREGYDPRNHLWLREYEIEPDASAASYFLAAAAITGGEVTIPGFQKESLQGDIRFAELLDDMGCKLTFDDDGLTLKGGLLTGIDADMNDISDCVMTMAAVACFAKGPTTIRNVGHVRYKESDRLAALETELRKVGVDVVELTGDLHIRPGRMHGAELDTYNDHRLAMSFALLGLRVPGIVINDPGCVAKTYPDFFKDLERLRESE